MLFEYPPCNYNLAYDEFKGVCDYANQVEGCTLKPTTQLEKPQEILKGLWFLK